MAFKMNRPFKMNGPKKSGLKLGSKMKNAGVNNQISGDEFQSGDTGSGLFYNSKMGPMKMVSPTALKQMEEEATDETFPSGETKSERDQFNDQETSSEMEKEGGEKSTIPGQDIISEGGEFWFDTGGNDQIYIEDPDGIVAANTSGDYVDDVDFLFERTEDGYYKVTGVADVSEGGEFEEGVPGSLPQ
tara:strand:- start:415 stop:978 length:564 start_codon:yes stop_codon:yes gene_type:complete